MKYKINYKATDRITDNPIIDIETNDEVPLVIKEVMIPVINKFKELGYSFFSGRVILNDKGNDFLDNTVSIILRNKEFTDIHFLIFYDSKKDVISSSFVSKDIVHNNRQQYVFFKKEELKILDTFDFTLSPPFVEETGQDITNWMNIK